MVAGALVALASSQLVLHYIGGGDYSAMGDCTFETFLWPALPAFTAFLIMLKVLAKVLRPPPPEPKAD